VRISELEYRPIDQWRGELTRARKSSPFKASDTDTLRLLCDELNAVRATAAALLLPLGPSDFKVDGRPKVGARPAHPGVVLVCTLKHGPFRMQCDTFTDHYSNMRAIALSLEALRKMERYGCTKRGEQYRGWTAIAAGDERDFPTREAALAFLVQLLALQPGERVPTDELIRRAMFKAHPDRAGGTETMMKQVLKAKAMIEGNP